MKSNTVIIALLAIIVGLTAGIGAYLYTHDDVSVTITRSSTQDDYYPTDDPNEFNEDAAAVDGGYYSDGQVTDHQNLTSTEQEFVVLIEDYVGDVNAQTEARWVSDGYMICSSFAGGSSWMDVVGGYAGEQGITDSDAWYVADAATSTLCREYADLVPVTGTDAF